MATAGGWNTPGLHPGTLEWGVSGAVDRDPVWGMPQADSETPEGAAAVMRPTAGGTPDMSMIPPNAEPTYDMTTINFPGVGTPVLRGRSAPPAAAVAAATPAAVAPEDAPEQVTARSLVGVLMLCCVLGLCGLGMAIAWGAQGRETDSPCDGTCELNSNSMERRCVGGSGCCGAFTSTSGQVYAETCTERSTKLLVFGCVLMGMLMLTVFAAVCLYSCYGGAGAAGAAGGGDAEAQEMATVTAGRASPVTMPPSAHAHVHMDAAGHHMSPAGGRMASVEGGAAHAVDMAELGLQRRMVAEEAAARGVHSPPAASAAGHADAIIVSQDTRGELNGRYIRCARLVGEFPVWQSLDGRTIVSTKHAAWGIYDENNDVIAQSVTHCGRMPHELTEPLVWQGYTPATETWEVLPKLRLEEGYTESSRVEVRLDDLDADVVRWVGCQILNVLSDGTSYQIRVLPTQRYNGAEGLSGVTLEDPVSGALLRRSKAGALSPVRTAQRGAPKFEAKHINVKSILSPNYSRVTIVNNVGEDDARDAVVAKLYGTPAARVLDDTQADVAEKQYVLVNQSTDMPVRMQYDDVCENSCYVLKEVRAAELSGMQERAQQQQVDGRSGSVPPPPPLPPAPAAVPSPAATVPTADPPGVRTPNTLKSKLEKLRTSQSQRKAAAAAAAVAAKEREQPQGKPAAIPPSPAAVPAAADVRRGLNDEFSERSGTPPAVAQAPASASAQAQPGKRRDEVLSLQAKIQQFTKRTAAATPSRQ